MPLKRTKTVRREKVSGKLEKKGELYHVEKLEAAGFG